MDSRGNDRWTEENLWKIRKRGKKGRGGNTNENRESTGLSDEG